MKPLINGTNYAIPGYPRAKIDGGLRYIRNGEERCAWIGGPDPANSAIWRDDFNRDRLMEWAEEQTERSLVVLNVEHYPTHQLGKLVSMLEVIRAGNPTLKLGIWSVVPASAYFILAKYAAWKDFLAGKPHDEQDAAWWAATENAPTVEAAYKGWKSENDLRAKILGPHIEVVVPSGYPTVEPPADKLWMGAREPELMIAECRRLFKTKQVLLCWNPHLPNSTARASDGYASAVIKTGLAKADGVIVWADRWVSQSEAAGVMGQVAAFQSES